jgi:predicted ester cyclase
MINKQLCHQFTLVKSLKINTLELKMSMISGARMKLRIHYLAAALLISSTAFAQTKDRQKTSSANKKLMLSIVDNLFNKGDTTFADKHFVPEFAKEEKAFTNLIRTAFPDLVITVDIMVAEKDMIAVRWVANGTQKGKFLGIDPTNKNVSWKGSWFWTFKNGIVTDGMGKGSWDALGLVKQLQAK